MGSGEQPHFGRTGIKRKTGDLIRGGVGFGNFAVDFLAFILPGL